MMKLTHEIPGYFMHSFHGRLIFCDAGLDSMLLC